MTARSRADFLPSTQGSARRAAPATAPDRRRAAERAAVGGITLSIVPTSYHDGIDAHAGAVDRRFIQCLHRDRSLGGGPHRPAPRWPAVRETRRTRAVVVDGQVGAQPERCHAIAAPSSTDPLLG